MAQKTTHVSLRVVESNMGSLLKALTLGQNKVPTLAELENPGNTDGWVVPAAHSLAPIPHQAIASLNSKSPSGPKNALFTQARAAKRKKGIPRAVQNKRRRQGLDTSSCVMDAMPGIPADELIRFSGCSGGMDVDNEASVSDEEGQGQVVSGMVR
jgi:hypothetical protein